jgi:fatty acid desaturase
MEQTRTRDQDNITTTDPINAPPTISAERAEVAAETNADAAASSRSSVPMVILGIIAVAAIPVPIILVALVFGQFAEGTNALVPILGGLWLLLVLVGGWVAWSMYRKSA